MSDDRVKAVADALGADTKFVMTRAPGRVNLIGEHTDYNGGFALPFAIDVACHIAMRPRTDGAIVIASANITRTSNVVTIAIEDLVPEKLSEITISWARYVAAVLIERGATPRGGLDIAVESSIPLSSGLSSSAALEVATARALDALLGTTSSYIDLARECQRAEQLASGVPCGVMDQLASAACIKDHAMLLDCQSYEMRHVPIPADAEFLVVHSDVPRRLADGGYADRRAACERAAARLGIPTLRDAQAVDVMDDPFARHVVSENARVLDMVTALEAGDLERIGMILQAGHRSLSRDFQVSTPEVDMLVEELETAGAYGARITGAGFGGCVIAIVPPSTRDQVAADACAKYSERTNRQPRPFSVKAGPGASILAGA